MKNYEVHVGNIGIVHLDDEKKTAVAEYEYWMNLSAGFIGRAAGEVVTLFEDGEPIQEYVPGENE